MQKMTETNFLREEQRELQSVRKKQRSNIITRKRRAPSFMSGYWQDFYWVLKKFCYFLFILSIIIIEYLLKSKLCCDADGIYKKSAETS